MDEEKYDEALRSFMRARDLNQEDRGIAEDVNRAGRKPTLYSAENKNRNTLVNPSDKLNAFYEPLLINLFS